MPAESLSGKDLTKGPRAGVELQPSCVRKAELWHFLLSASVGRGGWQPPAHPSSEFLISKESKSLFYGLWDKQSKERCGCNLIFFWIFNAIHELCRVSRNSGDSLGVPWTLHWLWHQVPYPDGGRKIQIMQIWATCSATFPLLPSPSGFTREIHNKAAPRAAF